jgi:type III restriction enzyme
MRTIIYIDGFNLYKAALSKTPHKWLDLRRLFADHVIPTAEPRSSVTKIKFFTARVKGSLCRNPESPDRQARYILAKAEEQNYQHYLFQGDAEVSVEVNFDYSFEFHPTHYPANTFYRGTYRFGKHYYGPQRVGDLKSSGEEFECARAIDMHEQVEYWVRNLERKEGASYRLPLAHHWFYPDFVAMLKDGRTLIIEYKGGHLEKMDETKEKENIGQLWAAQSGGKCIFLMALKADDAGRNVSQQITAAISG